MSLFDIVLVIIIAGFSLFGFWFGLIHTLGSLVGTVVGVFLSTRYYGILAGWIIHITGWNENFSNVLAFIITFVIINRLIGLLFFFIDKTLAILTHLPFLSGINRILGAIFGFFEGVVVLGIIFYFINKFPLSADFMAHVNASAIVPFTVKTASILWPFIPQALKALQDTLQNIF